jgi:hypothetical protein
MKSYHIGFPLIETHIPEVGKVNITAGITGTRVRNTLNLPGNGKTDSVVG